MFIAIIAWNADGSLWLGGTLINGVWSWVGRATGPIILADWEQVQPDGSGNCLQIFDGNRADPTTLRQNYKWDDVPCRLTRSFACELIL